jgi:predicted transcriptional regulator
MSFEEQIQQWVQIDNQLKSFNEKIKELRDKKNIIFQQINNNIEEKQLNNATIKITNGQLKFVKIKETQPLTFKYLETCLSEIIKNEEQVKKIVEYIKNKRQVNYITEIKRFYNN